ncbi:MAG: hypothetical protein ABI169_11910, partial [Chitinophagaceae bacterium]
MKQISLLSLVLCLCIGFAKATTIHGVVTNVVTNTTVANQKVFIADSLINYYDSMLTNASGAYSFTLPSATTTGDNIYLWTAGCVYEHKNRYHYYGLSIISNFGICGSSLPYALRGRPFLPSNDTDEIFEIFLIRKSYDPVLMDTVLTPIDSMYTSTYGNFAWYYSSIPSGKLLLKAALLPGQPSYNSILPTYYSSSLNWSGATELTNSDFLLTKYTAIYMIAGTNPGGPGFIGGSVLLGANKTTAVGDPLNKRLLLLTTATDQAVAYTYSDASGKFSFPSLAYGTYKVFGDAWGKTNPPLTVSISASTPSVGNITFEENSKTFKGTIALSVATSKALAAIRIVPNPASNHLVLSGLAGINGNKVVTIRNITGATVATMNVASGKEPIIETASFPAGIYILQ